ncbi:beta-galactosidase trimerization domain-containing protein, partial [Granulicella sp. L56]
QELGKEFEKAAPVLAGTTLVAQVSLLHSYESRWAINWQRHNQHYDPIEAIKSFYAPLKHQAGNVDIASPDTDFTHYKLVIAPALNLLTETQATRLIAYVQNGGHLVLGQRSAMKNGENGLERQPGPFHELLGGQVLQFYALADPVPVKGTWGSGESRLCAEQLKVEGSDTDVLLRYRRSNGWLDDQPAAVTRVAGKGKLHI